MTMGRLLTLFCSFVALCSRVASACAVVKGSTIIVADQHDGDMKQISYDGSTLIILPYGNNETWIITADLEADCTAMVNFNVPGKPSPPPVELKATVYDLTTPATDGALAAIGFTDPTATISNDASYPVNFWIQIDSQDTQLLVATTMQQTLHHKAAMLQHI